MTGQNKLENCGFAKTILMLLVILGHACAFWSGNWFTAETPAIQSKSLSLLYSWINSFHIFAFTLVSGYIFTFKVMRGGYSEYPKFLKNKASRLLVPYVFVMLIWVAPISAQFFDWDFPYLFKQYILCINPSQLWFLWMLFDLFVILWPLRRILIKNPKLGYVVSITLYGVGIIGNRFLPNIFCIWTACQYAVFFYIGMRIRVTEEKNEKQIIETIPWPCWIIADVVFFAITLITEQRNGLLWDMLSIGLYLILHIVGAIMAWTTLHALANKGNWKANRIFMRLSSYSMPMYLFHQQIIYFTIVLLNGKVNPWINAGVNFVIPILGSFLISAILMKWKVTRFLIGEK